MSSSQGEAWWAWIYSFVNDIKIFTVKDAVSAAISDFTVGLV